MINIKKYEENKKNISKQGQQFVETIKSLKNYEKGFILNINNSKCCIDKENYSSDVTSWFIGCNNDKYELRDLFGIISNILDELKEHDILNYAVIPSIQLNQVQLKIF